MTQPESKRTLVLISLAFFASPIVSLSAGQLWWGFSTIPLLPFLIFLSFFLLTGWQYGAVVMLGGLWFDIILGYPLALSLVASVFFTLVLRILIGLLANRSFLSDSIMLFSLYGVWFLVVMTVQALALRIKPTAPLLLEGSSSVAISIVGSIFILLLLRRLLSSLPSIPRSLT